MTDKELMQQALEALSAMLTHMGMDEDEWNRPTFNQCRKAEAALRERLAQPEQEPVWIQPNHLQKARQAPFLCRVEPEKRDDFVSLYTAPPQRKPRQEQDAVLAEREACADIADQHASIEGIAQSIAAAIRARGNT